MGAFARLHLGAYALLIQITAGSIPSILFFTGTIKFLFTGLTKEYTWLPKPWRQLEVYNETPKVANIIKEFCTLKEQ